MARAEAMGLIHLSSDHTLGVPLLHEALAELAKAGIGRQIVLLDEVATNPRGALELLNHSIEASPHPETEWGSITDILGEELTGQLIGVSTSSIRRYEGGSRETPDDTAHRLHFIAMIIADLLGSYNRFGVRRWFQRPRRALQGASPHQLLTGAWGPDEPEPQAVAELARSLVYLGAT